MTPAITVLIFAGALFGLWLDHWHERITKERRRRDERMKRAARKWNQTNNRG